MTSTELEIKTTNPLADGLDGFDEEDQRLSSSGKKVSDAYRESKRLNTRESLDLERKGRGANDYEYRDPDDETNDEALPRDFRNSTSVTFSQKIRRIGKKTTCMAFCLLSFGIGMLITSFVFASRVSDGGFYLFLLIGICAIIPGSYASYHVVGRFFGWYGPAFSPSPPCLSLLRPPS
jgi:hypothetical protein